VTDNSRFTNHGANRALQTTPWHTLRMAAYRRLVDFLVTPEHDRNVTEAAS
jgi:hypothetical protein